MGLIGCGYNFFKGKSLQITTKEKKSYDVHVRVVFQKKAWCGEEIMKEWINTEWSNPFTNPIRSKKNLIVDVHSAQQTDYVKAVLTKKMTSFCNTLLSFLTISFLLA